MVPDLAEPESVLLDFGEAEPTVSHGAGGWPGKAPPAPPTQSAHRQLRDLRQPTLGRCGQSTPTGRAQLCGGAYEIVCDGRIILCLAGAGNNRKRCTGLTDRAISSPRSSRTAPVPPVDATGDT